MKTGRENKREVQMYLEYAREDLITAKEMLESKYYSSSVNRSYHVAFYAANALLATLGEALNKHNKVIRLFRIRFIKTGELPAELNEIYGDLLDSKQSGDYDLHIRIEAETTRQLHSKACQFLDEAEKWLKRNDWL